jgi:serine/threonine protein kinase
MESRSKGGFNGESFYEKENWKIICNINSGLYYIQESGYVHFDVSHSNSLSDDNNFNFVQFETLIQIKEF